MSDNLKEMNSANKFIELGRGSFPQFSLQLRKQPESVIIALQNPGQRTQLY